MSARYLVGDVFEVLTTMEPASVDLAVSSPPFLALRSYLPADHPDKAKEIGSEATPADFLDTLLDVTEAIARVLAPHGSLVFELGDTYAGSGGAGGDYGVDGLRVGQPKFDGSHSRSRPVSMSAVATADAAPPNRLRTRRQLTDWPQDKSLAFIPSLYGASLAYGRNLLRPERTTPPWRIRNLRPWVRNNPPVGALGDKVRPATSYMVVATKARDRYFDLDAVRKPASPNTHARTAAGVDSLERSGKSAERGGNWGSLPELHETAGAPPLDWVLCNPKGYAGSHYAVWPEELLHEPIESMCPRRVCQTCGKPSRRLVDVTGYQGANGKAVLPHVWQSGVADGKAAHTAKQDGGVTAVTTTTGWTTCACPGTDGLRLDGFHAGPGWRPGVVLDPFGGSGTTGVVAVARSRDCVLIDLDARNAELAYGRLGWMLDVVA